MSILVGAVTLQACSTPYTQPEGENVAVLRIKSTSDRPVEVKAFKSAAECSGGKMLLTPNGTIPAFGELVINVKPDEPFSFFVGYAVTSGSVITYCNLPTTFTPRARGMYTAHFSVNASERNCYMPVMVQTTSGEQLEPSLKFRQWQTPFAESGSFCK